MGIALITKKLLHRMLPMKSYLQIVSSAYFLAYDLGLLKKNRLYHIHYFIKEIVRPGDTVLDIGANLGYYSRNFLKIIGPQGHLHAVEPMREVREVLLKNIGSAKNVTIYPYAIGADNKIIVMKNAVEETSGTIATGSFYVSDVQAEEVFGKGGYTAEMRSGKELFSQLKKCDYLKCDVEGFEVEVFQELKNIFEYLQPVVQVETFGENRDIILKYLEGFGYRPFMLNSNLKLELLKGEEYPYDLFFLTKTHQSKFSHLLASVDMQ